MTADIFALEYFNVDGSLELMYFNDKGVIDIKSDITTTQPEEPGIFAIFILKPDINDMSDLDNNKEVVYEGIGQISDYEKLDFGYEMAEELINNDLDLLIKVCKDWPSKEGDKHFNELLESINSRMTEGDDEDDPGGRDPR
jgi:hypothetical protein